jgi:guanine deaminase
LIDTYNEIFMQRAIQLSIDGMNKGEGGPFGAVVVQDGVIIGQGNNKVLQTNDPTAHAEVVAIRDACRHINHFQLTNSVIYTSCEPCPMCLGAIYWARPKMVFYGCTKADAAAIGFDDDFIYDELKLPYTQRAIPFVNMERLKALKAFEIWSEKQNKTLY